MSRHQRTRARIWSSCQPRRASKSAGGNLAKAAGPHAALIMYQCSLLSGRSVNGAGASKGKKKKRWLAFSDNHLFFLFPRLHDSCSSASGLPAGGRPGPQRADCSPAGAAMPKKTAAAAQPVAALACANAACGKALAPPVLRCSKCKAEAYCCKACQVGHPGGHGDAQRAARVCSLTRARSLPPCLPPPATRLPRGRQDTSASAAPRGRVRRRRSSCAPRGRPRARRRG